MAKNEMMTGYALKPFSAGTGTHIAVGEQFQSNRLMMERLIAMGKASLSPPERAPAISEPEVTAERARRGRQAS